MTVTVVEPGKKVKVSPVGGATIADVLEYAEHAIAAYGFRQGAHDLQEKELWEKPGETGLSLHDAVGYAFVKLSSRPGDKVPSGSKDARLQIDEALDFGRDEVYGAVHETIEKEMPGARAEWEAAKDAIDTPSGKDPGVEVFENWFNNTTNQDSVIRVLRVAREEAVA